MNTKLLLFGVPFMVIGMAFQSQSVAQSLTEIEISTRNSLLTLCVGSDSRLYQLGYHSILRRPGVLKALPVAHYDRAADRQSEFFPSSGNGFLSEPALRAVHADGNTSTDLIYVSHSITPTDDPNVTLVRINLQDSKYHFFVTQWFKAYRDQDTIEQWVDFRNEESGIVTLKQFASSSLVMKADGYWLTQFYGYHMREAEIFEEKLTPGTKVLDSKLGVRAHQMRPPSFMLSLDGPAREESGEVIGGSLEWSGDYRFAFDLDWENSLRALTGINGAESEYQLKPNETFSTPAMLWSWSDGGKGQVSRNFHHWAEKYGVREGNKLRPVILNNWESTAFKFDEKKLLALLDNAKQVGAELFLLDDGWFGTKYPRDNDRVGLGDWEVNPAKLPHNLSYLVEEAKKRGIDFGIWLEPEMVSPKSNLFEQHPDWVLGQPGREPILGRSQRVLDLTRPAVKEFVYGVIDKTLKDAPGTRYVKWDCNAYALQPGSSYLSPVDQGRVLIDYQSALYEIMKRVEQAHPDVMMMLCSSGPARLDFGSLRHFHTFWASDNTDPMKRVFIQWGFSHLYPANSMSCHVTNMGKRPLKFATDVALSGAFGIDMDVAKLPTTERENLAESVRLYKEQLRDMISKADLYRLESPYENPRSALAFVSPDKAAAVLFVYQIKDAPDPARISPVHVAGLDPGKRYRLTEVNLPKNHPSTFSQNATIVDGSALTTDGIVPPCARTCDSTIIKLVAE